jgi:putative solute:sodium symporter small subunit
MTEALRDRFWRSTQWITAALLLVWLAVSVTVPWFARDLDVWQVFGFPLGYWLASEGALLVFLLIIVVDVLAMERLEAAWHADEAAGTGDPGPS